jgi:hypothetical protein
MVNSDPMAYRLRLDHPRMTQSANRILTDAQLRVTACEEQAHLKTIRFLARFFNISDFLTGFPIFPGECGVIL